MVLYMQGGILTRFIKNVRADGGWAGSSISNYKYLNDNGNEINYLLKLIMTISFQLLMKHILVMTLLKDLKHS